MPNCELGRVPSLRDPIAKRREREGTTFNTSHALAQAIMSGWKKGSPVDCLVISPQFEVIGRQSGNDLLFAGGDKSRHYLTFLQESLAGKLPGLGEDSLKHSPESNSEFLSELDIAGSEGLKVILTREKPEQEILNIFQAPGHGLQDYTVVEIDATAFENGGVLTIDISVGHAEVAGSFDLFADDSKLPTQGAPQNALASGWGIPPGGTERITYPFDRGQSFQFGATGDWFSEKGSINAFLATISVKPTSEEQGER